ncbi:hypothetical protein [Mesorhizobium loti]|uniref:Uncharacterized protein n=1 Tax=Mesorhizobium loti R88b TaxID=935548 RepID=A0A6M7WS49_RHILI|nr:hypothetical protein [Mesorhizobium loti]QKD03469.1 hypothetical protein EB235_19795 [Mesorhizobium loti R88b]
MMLFKGFIGLCFVALIAQPILDWLQTKLVYKDDGYGVARRKVIDEQMRLGASWGDAQDTLLMCEMLARVRRESSDAARANPALWLEHIDEAKKGAAAEISAYKPYLVSRFMNSVDALPYSHILYPHEANMINRSCTISTTAVSPTEDQWAALRTVRN